MRYQDIIDKYASVFGIDPNLIHSVIQHESGYNPSAKSPAGAMGLMQLMPSTAKGLGVTNPLDPEQNIKGGAKMLGNLMKTYGGNIEKTLAAYNAGAGNVAKYGGIPPFSETRNYVKNVMKTYNALMNGLNPPASAEEAPHAPSSPQAAPPVTYDSLMDILGKGENPFPQNSQDYSGMQNLLNTMGAKNVSDYISQGKNLGVKGVANALKGRKSNQEIRQEETAPQQEQSQEGATTSPPQEPSKEDTIRKTLLDSIMGNVMQPIEKNKEAEEHPYLNNLPIILASLIDPTLTAGISKAKELSLQETKKETKVDKQLELLKLLNGGTSGSGASFRDMVDIYAAQGLISEDDMLRLKTLPAYINNERMPSSSANLMLRPYMKGKELNFAKDLEGTKQDNRLELEGVKQTGRKEIADYTQPLKLEVAREKGKIQADIKGNVPSALTPEDKALKEAQLEKTKIDTAKAKTNTASNKYSKQIAENNATIKNINDGLKAIDKNPGAYNLLYGTLPAQVTNRIDPGGVDTRAKIDNVSAVYRKWLTGAQMSDKERLYYERFLPAPSDDAHTVKEKLKAMKRSIENQTQAYKEETTQGRNGAIRKRAF